MLPAAAAASRLALVALLALQRPRASSAGAAWQPSPPLGQVFGGRSCVTRLASKRSARSFLEGTGLEVVPRKGRPSGRERRAKNAPGLELEDHGLLWDAAGLSDCMVACADKVLPPSLVDAMCNEASIFDECLAASKCNSFWFPFGGEEHGARCAMEEAILRLFRADFPRGHSAIVGAEWWIQKRPLDSTRGATLQMHYDKDEAFFAAHFAYKFPPISTVTYLSDAGAPTLIFNMTYAGENGTPRAPSHAYLSFPRRGRHLSFRGSLQHGVPSALAPARTPRDEGHRVTFLINWWAAKPQGPNCQLLTDAALRSLGMDPARSDPVQQHAQAKLVQARELHIETRPGWGEGTKLGHLPLRPCKAVTTEGLMIRYSVPQTLGRGMLWALSFHDEAISIS